MRIRAGGAVAALAALLVVGGCVQSTLPSPDPSGSSVGPAGSTCAGSQAASTYVLNQNATPPLDINGAKVSVSGIALDAQGPMATIAVAEGTQASVHPNLRVGDTVPVGGKQMKVTHICVVDPVPSPMPPGASKGTAGLANA